MLAGGLTDFFAGAAGGQPSDGSGVCYYVDALMGGLLSERDKGGKAAGAEASTKLSSNIRKKKEKSFFSVRYDTG